MANLRQFRETYFGSVGTVLTWLSLAGIVIWAITRAAGWINTPLIVEIAPIILAAFAAGKFFQEQNEFKKEMRQFKDDTLKFSQEVRGDLLRLSKTVFKQV